MSFSDDMLSHNNNASDAICYDWLEAQIHQFSIDDVKNAFFADDPIISDENSDYGSYSLYVALGLSGAYLQMEYNSTTRQTIFYKTPCPVRNYCIAKCCAAFLTSALTMAMSISTFLWLLSFFRPLDNDVYLDASGYRLWYPSHPLFYFIIAATILSLGSGLFSIVALWISSYIQNSFAIMASPLLLYYTQSIIFNKLGLNGLRFLSFSSVFHFTPGFSSPAANFFYTCGYLLTLAVFFGWLFIKSVEKRWQYD